MEQKPHIVVLPFPVQGHIKPMLYLAQLLSNAGLQVTVVNTHHSHHRLSNLRALSSRFPTLHFESISDGLPEDHTRKTEQLEEVVLSMKQVTKPQLRDLIVSLRSSSTRPPVTCIIADGIMSFVGIDVAEELGIRVITMRNSSASYLWAKFCAPQLIEEGELPFGDDDMDREIAWLPGMHGITRRRDLPSAFRAKKLDDPEFQFFFNETQAMTRASTLILNTFDELEASVISQFIPLFSKVYTLGPLHALLKYRIGESQKSKHSSADYSLWNVDHNCITWLNSKPLRSVVYVSFGSLVTMSSNQLIEFWHGLVNSGKSFLLVIRPGIINDCGDQDALLKELEEGREESWCIVNWAPQEEVLAHPAVGGFLTHSGWNSTLEGITAGVPLICWPRIGDQPLISRWVGEVWKIGLDMKDTCDRLTIEKMVRTLMEDQREVIMESVKKFDRLARDVVSPGGSSYTNLDRLIEDLTKDCGT